ncbi:MAG: methionyl-tRNA formyltransferase [Armatimonadetes bacterium]|nr:methionyl-tRNA formyltransferase [Armatimonadota bacterium]
MNVIFVGTSAFAVPSLERVIASAHEALAVITQPDKPRGRGREIQISPVKEVALAHGIPVLQPEKIGAPESVEQIKALGQIGAMIVVAYGQKINKELLDWPAYGVVNVHGSILPKYRGAAPIQQAIICGEQQTGVTTMLMDEGWDTGDILLQKSIDIGADINAGDLAQELSIIGADLLVQTLDGLEDGIVNPIPQDDELATSARSLQREAGAIDWSRAAFDLVNLIRGCTPKPGAFTRINGALIKVWKARIDSLNDKHGEPGEVLNADRDGLVIAAGEGTVRLLEVQPESRQRMSAIDYLRGANLSKGDRFELRFEMK